MQTKISVIYDNPGDVEAFEREYADSLRLASGVPGVERIESWKVWPKGDGTPTPAYRLLDLLFPDYDTASSAVSSEAGGAFVAHVFALATGGVRIVFAGAETN